MNVFYIYDILVWALWSPHFGLVLGLGLENLFAVWKAWSRFTSLAGVVAVQVVGVFRIVKFTVTFHGQVRYTGSLQYSQLQSVTQLDSMVKSKKGSPYSITERRVPELLPVLGSQPAGDVSHKPGGRLRLLSARPAVTPATLKRAATNFAAW